MNNEQNQLATQQEPSVTLMLAKIIEGGITEQSVGVLEKMCALKERMDAREAERQFTVAFNALQNDTPVIVASSVIPNRGKYERFEDVMRVVGPLLIRHGFAVSFAQEADDKRIKVTCHLRHIGGHTVSTPFAVRLGGRADSDTQADCKASTTAKRNALLQALNIVIRQDVFQNEDDARIEGGFITPEEAAELEQWVESLGADRKKFLEFAGAPTFAEIPTSKLEMLQDSLRKKEKGGRK